jgi:hypothetical protein
MKTIIVAVAIGVGMVALMGFPWTSSTEAQDETLLNRVEELEERLAQSEAQVAFQNCMIYWTTGNNIAYRRSHEICQQTFQQWLQ